jgi:hypothetical protein
MKSERKLKDGLFLDLLSAQTRPNRTKMVGENFAHQTRRT